MNKNIAIQSTRVMHCGSPVPSFLLPQSYIHRTDYSHRFLLSLSYRPCLSTAVQPTPALHAADSGKERINHSLQFRFNGAPFGHGDRSGARRQANMSENLEGCCWTAWQQQAHVKEQWNTKNKYCDRNAVNFEDQVPHLRQAENKQHVKSLGYFMIDSSWMNII